MLSLMFHLERPPELNGTEARIRITVRGEHMEWQASAPGSKYSKMIVLSAHTRWSLIKLPIPPSNRCFVHISAMLKSGRAYYVGHESKEIRGGELEPNIEIFLSKFSPYNIYR